MSNVDLRKYVETAMTYGEYVALMDELLAKGMATGADQSEDHVNYTKLNRQRMSRIDKTVSVNNVTSDAVSAVERDQVWLILTEGWCGDGAQNLPVVEKIAAENSKITTKYLLRDENSELMDAFLTAGARSIPKLIALDSDNHEVLFTWGPRPEPAVELFARRKAEGVEKLDIIEELQRWYNDNAGKAVQAEFVELLSKFK